jgi:hypothetical protein
MDKYNKSYMSTSFQIISVKHLVLYRTSSRSKTYTLVALTVACKLQTVVLLPSLADVSQPCLGALLSMFRLFAVHVCLIIGQPHLQAVAL